jgi:hypothetical protein
LLLVGGVFEGVCLLWMVEEGVSMGDNKVVELATFDPPLELNLEGPSDMRKGPATARLDHHFGAVFRHDDFARL